MIVWFIIFIVNGIHGLPNGAPPSACFTLLPRHGGKTAQVSAAPYEIHANLTGDKVVVRISSPSNETFEGLMLQARSREEPTEFIDGEFTESQLVKAIGCFDGDKNTLTHVNKDPKTEIITEWTPKEILKEPIIFRATVAKRFDVFWTEVDSNSVKQSSNDDSKPKKKPLYEKCLNNEEGCIGLGGSDGCVRKQDCQVLLRYFQSAEGINFILEGHLEKHETNYMAMALSDDNIMGKDSVRECIRDGTNVIARDSWNEGKSNTRTVELPKDLYTGSFVDGLTSCSWTLPLVTLMNGQTYDFADKRYHILLAAGEVSGWRLKYHDNRMGAFQAINFTEFNAPENVSDPNVILVDNGSNDTGILIILKPEVTTGDENEGSAIGMNETITPTSSSSCLRSTGLILLFTGLLFATKESINYCIFKCLF